MFDICIKYRFNSRQYKEITKQEILIYSFSVKVTNMLLMANIKHMQTFHWKSRLYKHSYSKEKEGRGLLFIPFIP